jgi:hypothetical protein
MDSSGSLIEDWGAVDVKIEAEGLPEGAVAVERMMLDGCIPAAQAVSERGDLRIAWTAYRAPVFPSGVDVLSVCLENKGTGERVVRVGLKLPPEAEMAMTSVRLGNRLVVSIPQETLRQCRTRDWGYINQTTAMPGWAKPEGEADPAFANIRAGMGGIPILYRFKVEAGSAVLVVLGICESHYARAGIRPVLYEVEGARPEVVDPIERWGRHRPGVLLFRARDINGDGYLDVAARPLPAAPDRNPILNVIWVFPADRSLNLAKLTRGALNESATYYVDVGGEKDQCFYLLERMQLPVLVPAGESRELTFLIACPGGSAPLPESTAWTVESLRRAAREVFLAWQRRVQ